MGARVQRGLREDLDMEITIIIDDQQLGPTLEDIARRRGVPVGALVKRFIEQGVGRVCLVCAGMGTDNDAVICSRCKGTGKNPKVAY